MKQFKQLIQLKVVVSAMFLLGIASMEARSFQDENESGSSNKFVITASSTFLCGAGNIILTADVTGGTVIWYHNNKKYGTGSSVSVNSAQASGNWVALHTIDGCDTRTSNTLVLSLTPPQPSPISGQDTICPALNTGLICSVTNTPGCTYTWILPAGWTQTAGGTSNSITVTATNKEGGIISVTANNACGSSAATTLTVTVCIPHPRPTFMAYNLGADSTLDTPKKQMAYLASTSFKGRWDASVYGGWFQWGRKPMEYTVNSRVSPPLRYNTDHAVAWTSSMNYDGNGQIIDQDTNHVYNTGNNYDWSVPKNDTLWGNGKALTTITSDGGVRHANGNLYQNPVKTVNDPCPVGYRIPTQDEWERMGNYDCNPSVAGGIFTTSTITKLANNSELTWVAVRCGGGDCIASNTSWTYTTPGGYAIYETAVWEASGLVSGSSLIATNAPEPLLFLPAAGGRHHNDGITHNEGTHGGYYSSSINGNNVYSINFYGTNVTPNFNYYRAYGISVRCVKE